MADALPGRPEPKMYYKATRVDGYSFQGDPKVLYEVGATVVPASAIVVGHPRICGPGYLHASDIESETLIGGSWPCRLFEVSGEPVVGFSGEHEHKGGFLSLTVEREIEAHRALGPNGAQVAAFIERCKAATKDDWKIVIRERGAALGAALGAARDAAWGAARDAAWGAARGAAWGAARGAARDAARGAALDAAWGAALGLVVRDKLTPEQFDLLYEHVGKIIPVESLLPTAEATS